MLFLQICKNYYKNMGEICVSQKKVVPLRDILWSITNWVQTASAKTHFNKDEYCKEGDRSP